MRRFPSSSFHRIVTDPFCRQDDTHADDLLATTEEQQAEIADLDEEVLSLL